MSLRGVRFTGPPSLPQEETDDGVTLTSELMDFTQAVRRRAEEDWKLRSDSAMVSAPLDVLFAVLRKDYRNSLSELRQQATRASENIRLSQALAETIGNRSWSVATARKYATFLKRVLNMLDLPAGFVESLRLVPIQRSAPVVALGKFTHLPEGNPVRVRLEEWVELLRSGTRNRSGESIRAILRFFCNSCLPALGLDLDCWPEDPRAHIFKWIAEHPGVLEGIVGQGVYAREKAARLDFFLRNILGADVLMPTPPLKRRREEAEDDCGQDLHRISSEDLQRIHDEARKNQLDELLFMLMLTTGLRVGGVAKLKISNVADVKDGTYVVRAEGRTLEKGSKKASFLLCPDVKRLLLAWLTSGRPADCGPYVFPGATATSHVAMSNIRRRFKNLCLRCGLEGAEFHPHALRHTNAHILLECGNSADVVSKRLNHSSVAVTQQFYLKESAAEVQARCNVPWQRSETEAERTQRAVDALPPFLQSGAASSTAACSSSSSMDTERRARRRETKKRLLASLVPS